MEQELLREVLIARQPILTAGFGVLGYELLYRDSDGDGLSAEITDDGDRATASVVIDGLLGLGLLELTGGDDAWVNVPPGLLVDDTILDVPPEGLVIELLGGPVDHDELHAALVRHRAAGFRIALSEVVSADDPRLKLADLIDVIKVDVPGAGVEEGLRLVRQLAREGRMVLAEKVEDPAIFERAAQAGAKLFQGFFFTRPLSVRGMRPLGIESGHLQLLRELARDEVDLRQVELLIRGDVTVSDRFLRLVRSRSRGIEVESIHHGLVMLGVVAVQRWVNLVVMSATVRDAPSELVAVASARARGCELLERARGGNRMLEAFSLGMFSILGPDGILDSTTMDGLPVSPGVRAALEYGEGPFRPLLEVMLAAEQADWGLLDLYSERLGVEAGQVAAAHAEALSWSIGVKQAIV